MFRALGSALTLVSALACAASEPSGAPEPDGDAGSESTGAPAAGGAPDDANAGGSGASGGAREDAGAGRASGGSPNGGADAGDAYAHVVAVSATGSDGAYTFSVSVESADVDCTQFADFWEVLGEDGMLVYRRILEHSHTDANGTTDAGAPGNTFTRDGGPVAIGATEIVLVRAHMNTSGYEGRVMRGSVADGFSTAADIDGSFAADVEDDMPQPTGCLF